ncbi:hypothetical protein [Microbacterium sp. gxy059]|uniref:hypothetical protein n=1 Tax=Microbacterium sp. gxy059 TaxID=2957199 RepID=UPI003D964D71
MLTIDHDSPLSAFEAQERQREHYRGLPDDLRPLAIGREPEYPLLRTEMSPTPMAFATGVFWFDGRNWRITEGLAARIESDERFRLADTGIRFCLRPFE